MFDIGWSELLLIAVVALVAVGPKELPGAILQLTRWLRQAKGMAREFQSHVDAMVREVELDDLRKSVISPAEIERSLEKAVDPDREMRDALDPANSGLDGSAGSPVEEVEEVKALPAPAIENELSPETTKTPEKV